MKLLISWIGEGFLLTRTLANKTVSLVADGIVVAFVAVGD